MTEAAATIFTAAMIVFSPVVVVIMYCITESIKNSRNESKPAKKNPKKSIRESSDQSGNPGF